MILGLLPPLYLKKIKSLNSQSAKAKAEALFSCSKKEATQVAKLTDRQRKPLFI